MKNPDLIMYLICWLSGYVVADMKHKLKNRG